MTSARISVWPEGGIVAPTGHPGGHIISTRHASAASSNVTYRPRSYRSIAVHLTSTDLDMVRALSGSV